MNKDKEIRINITSGSILKVILFLLFVVSIYFLRDLVLIVLTAIVIASSIEPATKWLVKRKIPRVLSVIFIYFFVIFILAGAIFLLLPSLLNDMSGFLSNFPQYIDSIKSLNLFHYNLPINGGEILKEIPSTFSNFRDIVARFSGGFINVVDVIFGGIFSFVLIIVLSFYFAVKEDGISEFLKVVTPIKYEKYVVDLWRRSQKKIGLWMQGQLLLGVFVAILVYLGLTILGVKNVLLLAVIAGIFEIIPLFGPILAAIPGVIIAFSGGGLTLGLLVLGLYIIIQQFESNLIYPLVVNKIVGISPIIIILALLIGWRFAGFLGVILSAPIAAAFMELYNDIQKEKITFLEHLNI